MHDKKRKALNDEGRKLRGEHLGSGKLRAERV